METKTIGSKPALAVCGALALAALVAWAFQQMQGLSLTGMSNLNSWGLYIICFMFFVGLSAGGLIVASSATVFHIEKYKKVALPAVILSTVCICLAGAFILIDLGGIQRIWCMVVGLHFTSPLAWDMIVITCYLIINILYLYFMCAKNADRSKIVYVSRVALPVAILVHTITAWIFGLQIGREGWYSAIMGPLFVTSALDSGLALLILALLWLDKKSVFKTEKSLIASLAGLMVTCVAVDGYLVGCEVLTSAYPGAEGFETILMTMVSGATAPFFWFEVLFGILVPFCILLFKKNRENTGLVVLSSALIIAGVFCKRVWLLLTSFVYPNISGTPGVSLGTVAAQQGDAWNVWGMAGSYAPTIPEVVITVGTVAFGVLAFIVLVNKLVPKSGNTASHK